MTQSEGLFKTLQKLWMSEKFVWFRKLVEDVEVPEKFVWFRKLLEDVEVPDMLENVEIAL